MYTPDDFAKMIDHSILHPTLTDDDLKRECEVAKKYDVASVCVKPFMVQQAAKLLEGTDVLVGTVVSFPAGNSTTETKVFETNKACEDGAVEIDMVVNIGKVLQGHWDYVAHEIEAVAEAAHNHEAILKVIFETDFLTNDADKIRLSEICTKAGADYVKTSTGFGFVKGKDGKYSYTGATLHDIELMRKNTGAEVKIKAAGAVSTLDRLIEMKEAGCTRCGATATETIMEEALKRFG